MDCREDSRASAFCERLNDVARKYQSLSTEDQTSVIKSLKAGAKPKQKLLEADPEAGFKRSKERDQSRRKARKTKRAWSDL